MENMHEPKDSHSIPMTSVSSGKMREARPDIAYYTDQIANLMFVGTPGTPRWVLIDAGMPHSAARIMKVAEERFGKGTKPELIMLTHGHFDHIGSIVQLLEHWKGVPVYAHPDEFPFLTGKQAYPDPDPTVEGGMLAKVAFMYPKEPVDISPVLLPLPPDGVVPNMPGWKWIHTPGHSPGHVSFFRELDRTLIAGDAFVTVEQDAMYKVLIQKKEVHGPPPYLTTNWPAARESVRVLNRLEPQLVISGHGTHMEGEELRKGLSRLADNFDELALPSHGRYVHDSDREQQ